MTDNDSDYNHEGGVASDHDHQQQQDDDDECPPRRPTEPTPYCGFTRQMIEWCLEAFSVTSKSTYIRRHYPFPEWTTAKQIRGLYDRMKRIERRDGISRSHPDMLERLAGCKLRWTSQETEALRAAARRYGPGCWSQIVKDSPGTILERFTRHQLRHRWKLLQRKDEEKEEEEGRRFVLLDVQDENGEPYCFSASSLSTAAKLALKLGYELLRLQEDGDPKVHVYKSSPYEKCILKICVEDPDDSDFAAFRDIGTPSPASSRRRSPRTRKLRALDLNNEIMAEDALDDEIAVGSAAAADEIAEDDRVPDIARRTRSGRKRTQKDVQESDDDESAEISPNIDNAALCNAGPDATQEPVEDASNDGHVSAPEECNLLRDPLIERADFEPPTDNGPVEQDNGESAGEPALPDPVNEEVGAEQKPNENQKANDSKPEEEEVQIELENRGHNDDGSAQPPDVAEGAPAADGAEAMAFSTPMSSKLLRKRLRDELRALKSATPGTEDERRRLKKQRKEIKRRLSECHNQ